MNLLRSKEVWVCPSGDAGRGDAGELAYLVRVPTYYGMTAYRDRFARDYGPSPSRVEMLNDLMNAVELLEPADADRRVALADILARARLDPLRLSLLVAGEIEALQVAEERALAVCEAYRLKRARLAVHAELHVIEKVREHVADWRNMVDRSGEELRPSFATAHDGRQILSVEAVELIPEHHLAYLSRRIDTLERPTGQAAKNSPSRPSGTSTPKNSRAAASSHRSTQRKAAKPGKSRTSRTRTASATVSA